VSGERSEQLVEALHEAWHAAPHGCPPVRPCQYRVNARNLVAHPAVARWLADSVEQARREVDAAWGPLP
jgi:hypothetical protein